MKKLQTIDVYLIPLPIVAIAATILRTVALLGGFNSSSMHYDNKIAFVISTIIVAVSSLAFLSYLLLGDKDRPLISRSDNAASYIPAGIVSTALLFMGVENITMAFGGYPRGIVGILSLVTGVLALASIVSFFLSVFNEKRNNLYKAAFSLCIVLFLAVYAALLYFNKAEHPTNSPNRLIDQLAYLLSAIFFLYEARIPLGRAKWRGYVAFGLCATLMAVYSSVPALIYCFVRGDLVSESLIESILTLTMAIYIASKVVQIKSLTPDSKCDTAKSIEILASMREDEMKAQHTPVACDTDNMEENDDTEDASNYSFDIPDAEEGEGVDA